jgi:serpin B
LPRFRLDYGAELLPALSRLGLLGAEQDFGDIVAAPLTVSNVIHRALLEVDERGTTAAAATAVMMRKGALLPDRPFEMRVDRPFVCAVVDREAEVILFAAVVTDPPPTAAG